MKTPKRTAETLTQASRRVTADWHSQFPELGVYKPRRLLRRVGPLLEGIILERDSSNSCYHPMFHVHCLARPWSSVTLTLSQHLRNLRNGAPDWVTVRSHDAQFLEATARLRGQAPLALSGDLLLGDVVGAYERYLSAPLGMACADRLFEEMALICAWAGQGTRATSLVTEGAKVLRQWRAEFQARIGGVTAWVERVSTSAADQARLRQVVEEQAEALGCRTLPVARLVAEDESCATPAQAKHPRSPSLP